MFKVNNKDTRMMSLLFTLNIVIPCSSVSIVNFEQVNGGLGFSQNMSGGCF